MPSGRLLVNERRLEILGLRPLGGLKIDGSFRAERIHAEDLARSEGPVADLREGRLPEYPGEQRMRPEGREWVWVEERGRVISRTADGHPEWIFGTLIDVSDSMDQRQIASAVQRGTQEGSDGDLELPLVDREGRARRGRAIGHVEHEQGQATRLVVAIQEVTEAHRVLATLREAKRAAEAANEAKSMFLATMSHESARP